MRRLRHDLSFVVSAALLVAAAASISTGLISRWWDLDGFVYHVYAGYALTVLALAHVALGWRRLAAYSRFRWRQVRGTSRQPVRTAAAPRTDEGSAAPAGPASRRAPRRSATRPASRRGVLTLAAGSAGGFVAGRYVTKATNPYGTDIGILYHRWSKPGVDDLLGTVANWGRQPAAYKAYPAAAQRLTLPPPPTSPRTVSVDEAITLRRSARSYSGAPMTQAELSRLLRSVGGITTTGSSSLRAFPSAGALYPIEIYPVIHRVDDVAPGLYHYDVRGHALTMVTAGDLRREVVRQALMQEFLGECNVVLFFTLVFQRMRWRYQDRTYRYALLEAGHMGQNAYLAATAMGMGACAVGAFLDDEINRMLGVDGTEEAAVYMLSVGHI